jgi:hypothetical protein
LEEPPEVSESLFKWNGQETRVFRDAEELLAPFWFALRSRRFTSSWFQLGDPPNGWNLAACQVGVQIAKVLLEVIQRCPLGHVIGKFLQVSEPEFAILPIDKPLSFHDKMIARRSVSSNRDLDDSWRVKS